MNFPEMVNAELCLARSLHPPRASLHEAYAVILEELEEFWSEVKKKKSQRSSFLLLEELVQVAAMVQRAAEDLGLVRDTPSTLQQIEDEFHAGASPRHDSSEAKLPAMRREPNSLFLAQRMVVQLEAQTVAARDEVYRILRSLDAGKPVAAAAKPEVNK
jgi:hypothetical protein